MVKNLFEIGDMSNDGYLTFSEWVTLLIDFRNIVDKENIRAAFNLFDTGKDGTIDKGELVRVLGDNFAANEEQWLKKLKGLILKEYPDYPVE
mmetsp:Transcript_91765/g.126502  ORF Transcript_91765/g.126502 Transcript_91765/m.126502 type:complete len:92 (-) Transcript_91765:140-415(-)